MPEIKIQTKTKGENDNFSVKTEGGNWVKCDTKELWEKAKAGTAKVEFGENGQIISIEMTELKKFANKGNFGWSKEKTELEKKKHEEEKKQSCLSTATTIVQLSLTSGSAEFAEAKEKSDKAKTVIITKRVINIAALLESYVNGQLDESFFKDVEK